MTDTVTAEVEVDAPVHAVYNQWTQFEDFPRFLHDVKRVEQIGDMLTHWTVSIGGVQREFDAAITDQVPDDHVAWASVDERVHSGRVAFAATPSGTTRVRLEMSWEPETLVEKVGAKLMLDQHQAESDLERFRDFLESRGGETGGWRGEIHEGRRTDEPARVGGPASPMTEHPRDETLAPEDDELLDPLATGAATLDEWEVEDTTTGDGHPPREG